MGDLVPSSGECIDGSNSDALLFVNANNTVGTSQRHSTYNHLRRSRGSPFKWSQGNPAPDELELSTGTLSYNC